ncbi:MAK10-like protein [Tanacetum coccineum]|uniref:MAK10-like protein n=1 Tax=Tanacetum coccineum TaxID=301880 RepID=A0ABQ4ZTX6_9ASTR
MGDEIPRRTLGDYSRPSHEGYRNTIELLDGNNAMPLRSDTIQFVQKDAHSTRLRSEDPKSHHKDFRLKRKMMRLTNEKLVKTDIRLSLASQSHIYPLGIAADVLVEVAGFVYPVDFVILDIKEDRKKPFILGTPLLTIARDEIKFDKGIITLKSGKSKVNFHKWPEIFCKFEEKKEDKLDALSIVNKHILEWEESIMLHHEKGLEFDQWRNKMFNNKNSMYKDESSSSGRDENQRGVT